MSCTVAGCRAARCEVPLQDEQVSLPEPNDAFAGWEFADDCFTVIPIGCLGPVAQHRPGDHICRLIRFRPASAVGHVYDCKGPFGSHRQEVCKWVSGGGPFRLMIHVALHAS